MSNFVTTTEELELCDVLDIKADNYNHIYGDVVRNWYREYYDYDSFEENQVPDPTLQGDFDYDGVGHYTYNSDWADPWDRPLQYTVRQAVSFDPVIDNVRFCPGDFYVTGGANWELIDYYVDGVYDSTYNLYHSVISIYGIFLVYKSTKKGDYWEDHHESAGDDNYYYYRAGIHRPEYYVDLDIKQRPDSVANVQVGNSDKDLRVIEIPEANNFDDVNNSVRIKLPNDTDIRCADLVDINHPEASNIRIMTSSGIKSWRKEL